MKKLIETLHEALTPNLEKHKCDFCKKEFYVYEVVMIKGKLTCMECYKSNKT